MVKEWMCPECFQPAQGDRCVSCGAYPRFAPENSVTPGSYGDVVGLPRTSLAAAWTSVWMLPALISTFALLMISPLTQPLAYLLLVLVLVRVFWSYGLRNLFSRLYLRRRFGRKNP
jgi:hypothetical protein